MLYQLFRETLIDVEKNLTQLIQTASPSPDELTEDARQYLLKLRNAHEFIVNTVEKLPENIPEYQEMYFGPRIQEKDILYVLSQLAPLASDPKLATALYSYHPAKLFNHGCSFVNLTIELYWGWKKYSLGEYKTVKGQIPCFFEQQADECMKSIKLESFLDTLDQFKQQFLKATEQNFKDDYSRF